MVSKNLNTNNHNKFWEVSSKILNRNNHNRFWEVASKILNRNNHNRVQEMMLEKLSLSSLIMGNFYQLCNKDY